MEMTLKQKFLNYNVKTIKPLSETQAVNLGSNFISESFIFLVAGGLIFWERSKSNEKKGQVDDSIKFLLEKALELQKTQEAQISKLETIEASLEERVFYLERLASAPAAPPASP